MMVCVELPIILPSVANMREHWAKRAQRAKNQRIVSRLALTAKVKGMSLPCAVTLTRIAPRQLDGDNLQSAFKSIRDGIADALGVDDRDSRIEWKYLQEKRRCREFAVRMKIEETPTPFGNTQVGTTRFVNSGG